MQRITVTQYQYVNNRAYCEISLVNKHSVRATILNYGATLEKFSLPGSAQNRSVILSLKNPTDYSKGRNYLGGTVGRIIGRMRAGKWNDGTTMHQFELNDGPNHAHGGPKGFDTRVFSFRVHSNDHSASVVLDLVDAAGTAGYPGNLHLTVIYTLDDQDTLTYQLHATTDAKTLCNPANHTYFNLDGTGDILNQELTIAASNYLPLNENSIPDQGLRSVANTAFDLRSGKPLCQAISSTNPDIQRQHGLNHPFILDGDPIAATLTSSDKQQRLTLKTTAPAIVVYTGNHFHHAGLTANLGQYAGVALETQFPPTSDSTLNAITLLPGETFTAQTSWHLDY
ncbi:aldose epimerase family protein [Lacticaseibacillus zhaodongensis]|uniref:aldose epimerase family protein n=1 Tax=Lacticaseibacillus zhaodongensis TaxID=2668065 RepID=UPI0012D35419|nr:aldose epimerase family protein [Lacticaseibacillus zhaodongensis]